MNIISVCVHYPSQADLVRGVFVKRRLEALARLANVRVISPRPWFPWLRPRETTIADAGEIPPVERPRMFYIPRFFKRFDWYWLKRSVLPVVRRLAKQYHADLIDAHFGYPEGVGCLRAAQQLGLPAFITVRGNEARYVEDARLRPQLVRAFQSALGIITVSDSLKRIVCDLGIAESKVRVISNAVDGTVFFPGSREEARRRLGIDLSKRVLLVVGHLIHGKGHHLVVPAVAKLRVKIAGLECAVVGAELPSEGHYPRELRHLLRLEGLETAIHLVGPKPPNELGDWYRAADLFVLPTYREGCCNAVLEALACGLPVITTPVGDNANYVVPGITGDIVPVGDAGALENAIEKALARQWDPGSIARRIGRDGWDGVAHQVTAFFKERLLASSIMRS